MPGASPDELNPENHVIKTLILAATLTACTVGSVPDTASTSQDVRCQQGDPTCGGGADGGNAADAAHSYASTHYTNAQDIDLTCNNDFTYCNLIIRIGMTYIQITCEADANSVVCTTSGD